MRLSKIYIQAIRKTVHAMLGEKASIVLFGSRLDDSARGGDVDLFICIDYTLENSAVTAALLAVRLERVLDSRRVDVVLCTATSKPKNIYDVAQAHGVLL